MARTPVQKWLLGLTLMRMLNIDMKHVGPEAHLTHDRGALVTMFPLRKLCMQYTHQLILRWTVMLS